MNHPTRLFLASLLVTCAVQAAPVHLVTGEDYFPYTDRKLRHGGLATEIVERAFSHADRSVSLAWKPWKRGLAETLAGGYDATFPYIHTGERDKDFIYSSPVFELELKLFSRRGAGLDAGREATLAGKVACMPLGWAEHPLLARLRAGGQLRQVEPRDMLTCVKMVALGRADFFIADHLQGLDAVREQQAWEIEAGTAVLGRDAICLIAPRSNPASAALVDAFNQGLKILKGTGEYAAILANHTVSEPGRAPRARNRP